MKPYVLPLFITAMIFASCKQKQNVIPDITKPTDNVDSTYVINGIENITMKSLYDSARLIFSFTHLGGPQEKTELSVIDLPPGVSVTFNPASGVPSFSTFMDITTSVCKHGTYPIMVRGTTAKGKVREHKMNLVVTPIEDCNKFIHDHSGSLVITEHGSNKTVYKETGILINNGNIYFSNFFLEQGTVPVTSSESTYPLIPFYTDCNNGKIVIPEVTADFLTTLGIIIKQYTIKGTGEFDFSSKKVLIDYTVVRLPSDTFRYHMEANLKI